jgi:hypothetical protein
VDCTRRSRADTTHLLLLTVSTHGIPPFHSGEQQNQG